ncbi:MAG: DUF4389 domain-containing protein [Pseudomonadota bacterium]|jgi:hypothetical protein|uniref:DUF4389 domain-containing protein n=1 Tax=Thalassovita autumnalis TaxID=2072972 RepID=A0A0P1FN53_9RHOB|nr:MULTISPECIES: DUF4389 domain-containing protein [Thalassovita]MEC7963285.1 DUF4389 domain-containing protein [Pseudomonadota bacterium]MEC8040472.1 DUF4389 domain-containing protein [Pseudomonadota bacterium]MEC8293760.1 DUF4389 domain-containing protein [Pseudomonadota bacterium]CUH69676.1 hypothetical protein TL5118_03646 [Thalassovita autumnalis]CUH73079.1 hypothetical protein TL5120_02886 [Thalassovita autumnalis]|tara:strand:- start:258 stop:575 length:318 start_codon:yes stop_codon:yes gene_type:complete
MADPNEFDEVMPDREPRPEPRSLVVVESPGARILYSVVIWVMMGFASTVIGVLALLQAGILLTNGKRRNERIAGFGTDIGIWFAKATRYITADSEDKPWPWTELD